MSHESGATEVPRLKELESVFHGLTSDLRALDSAFDQVATVTRILELLDAESERLAAIRLEAVGSLRKSGVSYERISAATGLSKGRIAQLSRRAPGYSPGRARPRP